MIICIFTDILPIVELISAGSVSGNAAREEIVTKKHTSAAYAYVMIELGKGTIAMSPITLTRRLKVYLEVNVRCHDANENLKLLQGHRNILKCL